MKRIIIVLSLMIVALSSKAQQIVPLETKFDGEIPTSTYLKDTNGILNKYIGTWRGTYDNKNYTFIITKFKDEFRGVYTDILLIRYLIATGTGIIIEDTRSLTDNNALIIKGLYYGRNNSYYVLNYTGKNAKCGQSGVVFISTTKDNKQMKLFLSPEQGFIDTNKCPKVADQVLPTKSMYLNKQ